MNIEISNICNLQCSFCPPVEREKGMMSLEIFRSVISQVAPLTDQVTLHLMGDPLVHPKLAEFIDVCAEFQTPIFLVTNGVLMNGVKEELLLHPIIRQVNFSLHSFHDNYGDKDPTIYLNKIFKFTERAFAERPELYINYRLWNLDEPLGVGAHNRSMLDRVGQHFQFAFNQDIDVRRNKSVRIKNRLHLHFDTEFTWPALDLPILGERGTCYGLSSHFGVLADGTVVPCCLDKEGKIPLGNVKEQAIEEILGNERSQKILKGFKDNKLVENLCQRCQYITRFN
ncbi:radical SAM/SPASM domain-containing protein [Bdellovibrio svalbardensis]|uniref:SPASM domain-containing protein n=1 Tax=Bdellovibrio svalbardensis TaxID=2972972 RepID=A0ABT6DQM8_9BACT|nr:SPASM domain-containing protein [Bdellovibrio svalbardensis]MDG0818131.1 SPASM domain-containing protein [Bdellovibrio svalbardensis]